MKQISKMELNVKFSKYNAPLNPEENEDNFTLLSHFSHQYPQSTEICCWYCSYNFIGIPLGIPRRICNEMKDFEVIGCFCSFSCMLSFTKEDPLKITTKITPFDLIWFYKRITGKDDINFTDKKLHCAPNKYLLEKFGGRWSIERFRAACQGCNIEITHAPLIPLRVMVSCEHKKGGGCSNDDLEIKMAGLSLNKPKRATKSKSGISIEQMLSFS